MKSSFLLKALLVAAVLACITLYIMGKQTPPWTGQFIGKRVVIQQDMDPSLSTSWIFADVVDFKKAFQLNKGDECFVLTAPEWRWQDAKGGLFLVPVFCPGKGAGWGDHHILDLV